MIYEIYLKSIFIIIYYHRFAYLILGMVRYLIGKHKYKIYLYVKIETF